MSFLLSKKSGAKVIRGDLMERKVSVPLYAGAFLIALTIFVTGIYVGHLIDQSSMEDISEDLTRVSSKVASVHLLFLMEANSSSFCPVYTSELNAIDEEVERMGHKLTYLEDQKGVFDNDLKGQYFALEAESYLLSKKVQDLCGDDKTLLVYFYSNANCSVCRSQGIEILKARDELTKENISIKIYSFDGEIGSPVAEAMMSEFNATVYPTVVIDNKRIDGYIGSNALSLAIRNQTNIPSIS